MMLSLASRLSIRTCNRVSVTNPSAFVKNTCYLNSNILSSIKNCNSSNLLSISSPSSASTSSAFQLQQTANFSKYISKARTKRLPLTTKRVGKGFYKGKGARTEGRLTSKAKFIPIAEMRTELVMPDLKGFLLKPYVGAGAKKHIIDKEVKL